MKYFILATLVIASCSRASWTEDQGANPPPRATQNQTPEPLNPGAPPNPALPGHRAPLGFDGCKSQTLEVDVTNTKPTIKDFWTTTARYPQIKVTKARSTKASVKFYLNPDDPHMRACSDKNCAEQAGWSQIQNDLADLNGVTMMCLGQKPNFDEPPVPAATPQDSGSGDGRG